MMQNKMLLLIVIILVSGCTTHYVATPLPLPPRPELPELRNSDLQCLSDKIYQRVANRDLGHKHYEKRLEAVIKSTWEYKK